jgi:hypothetical protein
MITLHFRVFGYDIASLTLDVDLGQSDAPTAVDRGIKRVSRWWVTRGMQ